MNRLTQRRNSQKSPFRGLPNSRDIGKRYEVRYKDGLGTERVFGFASTQEEIDSHVRRINRHPIFNSPRIVDRETRREVKALEAAGG